MRQLKQPEDSTNDTYAKALGISYPNQFTLKTGFVIGDLSNYESGTDLVTLQYRLNNETNGYTVGELEFKINKDGLRLYDWITRQYLNEAVKLDGEYTLTAKYDNDTQNLIATAVNLGDGSSIELYNGTYSFEQGIEDTYFLYGHDDVSGEISMMLDYMAIYTKGGSCVWTPKLS